jgi:hypothetical protein
LGVDLGSHLGGDLFAVADPPPRLSTPLAIVEMPGAVVEVIRDLADAPPTELSLANPSHEVPPGAQFVHQEGFSAAHKKR